ncbi:uPF0397 protein [Anopheles sinensis]|uniref:UPF0397 protein n=1 Tax=Anopheles sinensis TaxID=74873 RepID=A0A084WJ22_ANOSI|nr:uPF0397 protein [Anopheles sinensis]
MCSRVGDARGTRHTVGVSIAIALLNSLSNTGQPCCFSPNTLLETRARSRGQSADDKLTAASFAIDDGCICGRSIYRPGEKGEPNPMWRADCAREMGGGVEGHLGNAFIVTCRGFVSPHAVPFSDPNGPLTHTDTVDHGSVAVTVKGRRRLKGSQ